MQKKVLLLGIGNVLWADEGFGVRTLERLKRDYQFDPNISLIDGGTQGIYLLQHIRECDLLIVFDAVDYALPGGTLKCVVGEAVPKFLGVKKVSLHQTGFQEVLALADMLGDSPRELLLIGVQPAELEDYGGSLTTVVKSQINPAIQFALDYLDERGIEYRRRSQALLADEWDAEVIAEMQRYERLRPSVDQAYRNGDRRVLDSEQYSIAYRPVAIEGQALDIGIDQHLDQYRKAGI